MALHPSLFTDYRAAKKSASVLANVIGCTLLQNAKGKPRIIMGTRVQDFPTWLAAASFLHQIRADAIATANRQREREQAARRERQQAYMDSLPMCEVIG